MDTTTFCEAVATPTSEAPNVTLEGLAVTAAVCAIALADRETVRVAAFVEAIVKTAVRAAAAVGENCTVMVQLLAAANDAVQVLPNTMKSGKLLWMALISDCRGVLPTLETVTVAVDGKPTTVLVNVTDVCDKLKRAALPEPLRATLYRVFEAAS